MGGVTENYPVEIRNMNPEENAEIFKHFSESPQDGFIRVGPKGYCYPKGISEILPKVYNMALRPDDVWVVTFPKSGTTWTQELVWLVANDFDYERAAAIPLVARFPFIEMSMFLQTEKSRALLPKEGVDKSALKSLTNSFEFVDELPSPRFIKSHLPMSQLPPALLDTNKMVFVARDPRDVAVSYYHHTLYFKYMGYTSDFKSYWNLFLKDLLDWCPFFAHLEEAWALRNHPNMLFLFYEDMVKDLPSAVKKVANFFGKTITEEQLSRACEHLAFDNFKKNKSVNMDLTKDFNLAHKDKSFIRQGKSGGWRAYFDEEMTQQAEQWIAHNLRNTELRFPNDK